VYTEVLFERLKKDLYMKKKLTTKSCDSGCEFEFQALWEAKNYRKSILNEFYPYLNGTTVEVGSGIGQFSLELARVEKVKKLICVEPDKKIAEIHQKNFPEANLVIGYANDLVGNTFADSIVSVNVLEHIENDESELQIYKKLLSKRNGCLCLLVPARRELYSDIDRKFGHFRRYTKSDLTYKLNLAGFKIKKIFYFNMVGYLAWYLNFKIINSTTFNKKKVKFFDKVIFPFSYFLESRLLRPPLGQSLVCVAE